MKKFINKTTSAYLENTTTPMRLDNRNKDFTIPNTIDMADM